MGAVKNDEALFYLEYALLLMESINFNNYRVSFCFLGEGVFLDESLLEVNFFQDWNI